ncbi:MAG: coiled-coil domain-containing protein [Bacteroidales bacterium]|jgi:predicted RNase H-like nuclease (RuvC/YqgF family)
MKKYFALFAIVSLLLMLNGCGKSAKKEVERLQHVNDSLLAVGVQKDTTLLSYIKTFNEIQSNLDSIKMVENIITQTTINGGEINKSVKDRINSDINVIYDMLKKNREMVADLKKRINQKDSRIQKDEAQIVELQKMIDNLTNQIETKNAEINDLKDQLGRMNIQIQDLNREVSDLSKSISDLSEQNAMNEQIIREKEESINTAYYIIGTRQELRDMGVIKRTGGFLGMGRSNALNENFNVSMFTKVNITNLEEIPIYKSDIEILTYHPSESFEIVKKNKAIDKIQIVDYNTFWSASKYLVIVTK